ncbi:hypothetical protein [Roseicitreum antarcticum]|uniref:Type IV pilus biogenesis protein PilP n=1 Tax=Roseicitreum antarcticum TaxID=564137 RepID=A0A1H3AS54_9RHOB|nr:hypothetical protein [Roseicitreum antarcticum]SDX32228.1 hypothetical protein SAMN04488238_107103 [Roseicitreum antarcticum]
MKPNFALSLTHESVALLHRASNGWLRVGTVALDSDDLAGEMSFWRGTAQTLAPHGVTCKLVIPNSEVLYRHLNAPGPDDARRRAQIVQQIDGLTPYSIDELVFDWVLTDAGVDVAVVARETLAEAEAFAVSHKLNPVSFVARPDAAEFAGEPFFGPTACAAQILGPGVMPERDAAPLAVNGKAATPPRGADTPLVPGRASPPAPVSASSAASAPVPSKAPAGPAPASKAPDTPKKPADAPTAAPAYAESGASAEKAGKTGAFSSMATKFAQAVRPAPSDPVPQARTATEAKSIAVLTDPSRPDISSADVATKAELPARAIEVPRRASETKAPEDKARSGGANAPVVAFRSRRSGKVDPVLVPPAAPESVSSRLQLPQQPKGVGARFAERAGAMFKGIVAPSGSSPAPADPKPAASPDNAAEADKHAVRAPARPVAVAKPSAVAKPVATAWTQPSVKPAFSATAEPRPKADAEPDARKAEAEAMTVFGARRNAQDDTGFLKRGVLLTVGLLLILGAVALASIMLTSEQDPVVAPQSATAPAPVAPPAPLSLAEEAPAAESASPDVAAPAVPEAEAPALSLADEAGIADEGPAAAEPALPQVADSDAAVREALGLPAETAPAGAEAPAEVDDVTPAPSDLATSDVQAGPQGMNPPEADQGGFALSTTTAPPLADIIAGLPTLSPPGALAAEPPLSLPPPAPFGTEFDLGPDGLVIPTPEGALTPQGIRVHSGSPVVTPPERPEAPPLPEPAAETQDQGALPQPDAVLPTADPALAEIRPGTRPARPLPDDATPSDAASEIAATDGIAPEVEPAAEAEIAPQLAESNTPVSDPAVTASPGGLALTALAGVRPAPRPSDLTAGAGSIGGAAVAPAEEVAAAPLVADNPMAVAASLRPNNRPSDFAARVQAMVVAQPEPPAAVPLVQQASAAAAATPRPSIPSSASVAEQATQTRAINLREVNLLGVFGTSNNRAALVRLSNGNVVRVGVGDTLDGGRVSSISDSELRYVKSGRNQVLTIGSSS